MIPDKDGALELLRRTGCNKRVILHCLVVADNARTMAQSIKRNGYTVDVRLVHIGGLLHDIGRSRTHSIHHGVRGAQLARECGLDKKVIRIIETHIGAGIPVDDAISLGLPARDFIPHTLEEKIVAHADNLVEDDRLVSIYEKVEILRKKKQENHIIERIMELNNEMDAMLD